MKLEFSRNIFEKCPFTKFHDSLPRRSRVVPCGQTDMTKVRVAFGNLANAPETSVTSEHKAVAVTSCDYLS